MNAKKDCRMKQSNRWHKQTITLSLNLVSLGDSMNCRSELITKTFMLSSSSLVYNIYFQVQFNRFPEIPKIRLAILGEGFLYIPRDRVKVSKNTGAEFGISYGSNM
jgi:hypothetical protein